MSVQQTTHLLCDGGLLLQCDADCAGAIAAWLPRNRDHSRPASAPQSFATIRVHCTADVAYEIPGGPHTLGVAGVRCWMRDSIATMHARNSQCAGSIDLDALTADLHVPADLDDVAQADVYSMLTLASALLLAKTHKALVHAAAVVLPDSRVWLLTGDTHAGKSTTTLNLMRAGCSYLSDDQVVLTENDGEITVEGWPRHFHLDIGWHDGRSTGFRNTVDPDDIEPGRWIPRGTLGGLLFPFVDGEAPTSMTRITAADALGRLIRQSPWVMTQADAAPGLLQLLSAAASLPAYTLSVGYDTYRDYDALLSIMQARMEP